MTEISKGKWTTLTLRREVKEMLTNYKELYKFKSLSEALHNCIVLSHQFRTLAELTIKKEFGVQK